MKGILSFPAPLLVWIGMVLAIVMEAKVKFSAPSVNLVIGLDIGRQVFPALTMAEWGLAIIAGIFWLISPCGKKALFWFLLATVCLFSQTVWILPTLLEQADKIIAGLPVETGGAHLFYVYLTVVKVLALTLSAHVGLIQRR